MDDPEYRLWVMPSMAEYTIIAVFQPSSRRQRLRVGFTQLFQPSPLGGAHRHHRQSWQPNQVPSGQFGSA